jgi:hypothetical protein
MEPALDRQQPAVEHQADALIATVRRLPPVQRERLIAAISQIRDEAMTGEAPANPRVRAVMERLLAEMGEDPEAQEERVVEKLANGGRLRSGFLVLALKEGRLGLFVAGLAHLSGLDRRAIRQALASEDQPELLALACVAVGIDRAAFSTILTLVRSINDGKPGGDEAAVRRALGVFGSVPADSAGVALRRVAGAV